MTNNFFIFLTLVFLLFGCEKDDLTNNQDSKYPTVINKFGSGELSEARTTYLQKNKFISTSINQFGFCDMAESDFLRTVESPPVSDMLTEAGAIEIVRNFVSENQINTGVKNPTDLTFASIRSDSDNWEGATYWYLKSSNQRIDTIEVLNTQINFHVKNGELHYCCGNWFPEIYLPDKFKFSKAQAKDILIDRVVSHYTFSGQKYEVKITASNLTESTGRLVIYPVKTEEKIELRVTWGINIPDPVFYEIFVDVMTGEIINESPTIIS